MGNATSCCSAPPADKYEVPIIPAASQEAPKSSIDGKQPAALVEQAVEPQTDAGKPAGKDVLEAAIPGAFSTTDPHAVASELAPDAGLPYQFHVCGPPLPPCDDLRLRTINALKTAGNVHMDADAIDAPPDPEIASILKLVQSIFEAPAALVALFDDRRIFIRDAEGAFKRGDFPWRWSFCGWTMASRNNQIMVIPDATKDARFCNNEMVKSGPGVRFYCGTPLMASNGHRIGTLCFADTKPREFDASRCVVLNNLAELVVRHLEKDIALQLRAHDNNSLAAAYGNLRRTLDCFDHCVVLLDVGAAGWRILFVNEPACKALGIEREALQGSFLSRLLYDVDGSMLPTDTQQATADRGLEFHTTANLSKAVVEELDAKAPETAGTHKRRFVLTFRPASREDLDEGTISIGVPSFIPAMNKVSKRDDSADGTGAEDGSDKQLGTAQRRPDRLYFMLLQDADKLEAEQAAAKAKAAAEAKAAAASLSPSQSSGPSVSFSSHHDRELTQPPESINGLTMGHLLGKGAYGSVYYGTWYGTAVAVKIIDEELPPGADSIAPPIEAILSKELRHPHIVATLRCARRVIGPNGSSRAVSSIGTGPMGGARGGSGGINHSRSAFSDDTARTSLPAAGNSSGGTSAAAVPSGQAANGSVCGNEAAAAGVAVSANSCASGGSGGTTTNSASAVPAGASTGGSEVSVALSQGASDSRWAVINYGGSQGGATGRPRRSSAVKAAAATTSSNAAAHSSAALAIPSEHLPEGPSSSTGSDGSEAYDDFDAGRDSNMSPFMLPPGSAVHGGSDAGGLAAHSGGRSGGTGGSERWPHDEVLVRHQTWLIMEYCDRGCLQDAVDRGWLRTSPGVEDTTPRMDAVLATAVELASALSFLHSKDIVHGDMSAWNVMLCTSGAASAVGGRGFVAKIADFGLARHLDIKTKIETRTYGTLTHMPAETLRDGMISKATDVYSVGVLLWQLYTGSRPWAGLRHGQIIVMVVTQRAKLQFPPGAPPAYEALALACMEFDPKKRPKIEEVLAELEAIRNDLC